jgi:hypothetical protein
MRGQNGGERTWFDGHSSAHRYGGTANNEGPVWPRK